MELLSKSAHMAEKEGSAITMDLVDRAFEEIEKDKYVAMVKSSPRQLQAALYSIISLGSSRPARAARPPTRRRPPRGTRGTAASW